jgi:hypothetical protein
MAAGALFPAGGKVASVGFEPTSAASRRSLRASSQWPLVRPPPKTHQGLMRAPVLARRLLRQRLNKNDSVISEA